MSVLTLVRHSQASFFSHDYDKLSELGQAQARLLGEYWVRQGVVFDEVYTGPRLRQRHTAELVGACHALAGLPWPQPVTLAEIDEYDLGGLLFKLAPEVAGRDAHFAELMESYQRSDGGPERARNFQKMFEALTRHWQAMAPAAGGCESWPAFRDRVHRGIRNLLEAPGRSRRVVIFTSGGFIGTAVQLALAAPDRTALEVNWRVRNCSLTDFVFTRDRLSLDCFNALPHLEDPALWTYR